MKVPIFSSLIYRFSTIPNKGLAGDFVDRQAESKIYIAKNIGNKVVKIILERNMLEDTHSLTLKLQDSEVLLKQ